MDMRQLLPLIELLLQEIVVQQSMGSSKLYTLYLLFQEDHTVKMYNNRRTFIIKILIILCLIYFAVHVIYSGGPVIRELQQSGRSLAALDNQNVEAAPLIQDGKFLILVLHH